MNANQTVGSTNLSFPAPQKIFTSLRCYTVNGLLDAALSINSKVYRPTSYFDLDSDAGGPSFGGYTFFSTIYSRYRVTRYDYEIDVSNLEADSVMFAVYPIPDTATPSEVAATAYPEVAIENNFGKHLLLGPKGGANASRTLRGSVSARAIWGTPEVDTDTAWAANTGTSPGANTWLMLTAQRINGSALSTGVQYAMTVTSHGYWDQRIPAVA